MTITWLQKSQGTSLCFLLIIFDAREEAIEAILQVESEIKTSWFIFTIDSAVHLLTGSRIIESATYCNQILQAPSYKNNIQKTSFNWIIRLLLSLLCWPKVILLSGRHCSSSSSCCCKDKREDVENLSERPSSFNRLNLNLNF